MACGTLQVSIYPCIADAWTLCFLRYHTFEYSHNINFYICRGSRKDVMIASPTGQIREITQQRGYWVGGGGGGGHDRSFGRMVRTVT